MNGHYRPFLRPGDVSNAKGVPQDHIFAVNRPVSLYPGGKTFVARCLVRIPARRVHLGRIVWRHPKMVIDEASALTVPGIGRRIGEAVLTRYQEVSGTSAKTVIGGYVLDLPL